MGRQDAHRAHKDEVDAAKRRRDNGKQASGISPFLHIIKLFIHSNGENRCLKLFPSFIACPFRIPAEFLLDENGVVQVAHYDRLVTDHLPMDAIDRYAAAGGLTM
jgi:hypothetical protein